MKARKGKVVVAMSGGVDSSVVAALLAKEGYECVGMHLRFWSDPKFSPTGESLPQNKCCSSESLEDARKTAHSLGMSFYVMNTVDTFKERVVDYFLETYRRGGTPNPCVECNRNIKFGMLLARAHELGADFLATGHYARKITVKKGVEELWMAKDKSKDQSYFLYHLGQEKLARALFPLGGYEKEEVRALAEEFGLATAQKKESQGVCFFPERTPNGFLKRHLESEFTMSGPIKTVDGETVGEHEGLPFYTIGQRKGIKIGGIKNDNGKSEPFFVVKLDREHNTLVVGRRQDIFCDFAEMEDMCFVSGKNPSADEIIDARIRYRSPTVKASLEITGDKGLIRFKEPVMGVCAGQSVVLYDGEKVLGGGRLTATVKPEFSWIRDSLSGIIKR